MSETFSDSNTESLKKLYLKSRCKPVYRINWLKNKGAILIIIWSYLVMSVFHLFRVGDHGVSINPLGIILIATLFIFPVGGWLADAYTGRYKMIQCCMWIMWVCIVLVTITELVAQWSITYRSYVWKPVLCILSLATTVGFGGFQSNIVQLGICQLTDASSTQITSFITWYVLSMYISGVTFSYSINCNSESKPLYIRTFVVAIHLTVAVSLNFLFRHWLTTEQVTEKSMNLMFKVIKYTIKHRRRIKYEGNFRSRFNVAKHIYGGAFSNQQVEDVKSMLWIITVIVICSVVSGGTPLVEYATDKILKLILQHHHSVSGCYKWLCIRYSDYLFTIGIIVLYEFAIFPVFRKCLPTLKITTRFLLGMLLFLFRILALLGLEAATYYGEQHTTTLTNHSYCIFTHTQYDAEITNYKWLLIPGFMSGLSSFFMFLSALEFIWAQVPISMTGLALGIIYACIGFNTLLQAAVAYPFLFSSTVPWENYPLSCQIWYFFLQGLITLVFLGVGVIVLKRYKERTRVDPGDPQVSSYTTEIQNGPFC